jgi:osmotically-inducible protein OsmY
MSVSQEKMKKDVIDELYWDPRIDASEVNVEIDEGKITLTGTVPMYTSITAATEDAWNIEGVNAVINKLEVEIPTTEKVPTDDELQTNIETSLILSGDIDSSDIEVSVKAGVATLKGSVDAYWKKLKAEDIASSLSGIVAIINKLAIVPTEDYIDQDIAEDIVDAITRNINVDAESVDVRVKDGVVSLSGSVDDWNAYEATMDAAKFTPGVIDIEDNLIIENL